MEKNLNITAIIQARLGSTRFPGKVLKKINKKTALEIIYLRLKQSKLLDDIIFAIPHNKKEKNLKDFLKKKKYKFFIGSKNNVLDRYYKCAKKYKSNIIVRVTGDCPVIDAKLVDEAIDKFKNGKADILTNCNPPTYPDGLDISVFNFESLFSAWKNAKTNFDKEHVVPFLLKNSKYKKINITHDEDLNLERWTLDEPEDLVVLNNIFARFKGNFNFSWLDVLKNRKKFPEDFMANKNIKRNEGSLINNGQKLWKRAEKIIPGGNMLLSKRPDYYLPNRWPTYYSKSKGSKIWDLDGKKFLDMSMMGVGTNILGYSNDRIDRAVQKNLPKGNLTTLNSPEEVYLAEKLLQLHPWAEMAKFTRSGGEANTVAIRIARAFTNRQKVAVCGYHGWHDWYLAANLINKERLDSYLIKGLSPRGVLKNLSGSVFTFEYNKFDQLKKLIEENPEIGIIKMEVSRNLKPEKNFLEKIREITKKKGIILIFDECTSGFRQTFGGLHKLYNVEPDMAIFGKALGNGYAINAIIGKEKIMRFADKTFISSTFWTERIGPTAALKTLDEMARVKSWEQITKKGNQIRAKWKNLAKKYNLKIEFFGIPAISSFIIKSKNFYKYRTLITQELLKDSILALNVIYFSTAHTQRDIDNYLKSLQKVFKLIAECEDGKNIDDLLEVPTSQNFFQRLN
mgnify:FL=1